MTLEGGQYDGAPTYAWTVSGGSLDDATAVSPTWTRPSPITADTAATISVTVTVSGANVNARSGTTDSATATINTVVSPTMAPIPVATAPSVTIAPVPTGRGGSSVKLSATVEGGQYDGAPTYAWTVSGGSLDDATAVSPTWTRPSPITADTAATITVTVSVSGAGVNARSGTTDSATATVNTVVTISEPNYGPYVRNAMPDSATRGSWTFTRYVGSCASRQGEYSRSVATVFTEVSTDRNGVGPDLTREVTVRTTETELRAQPDAGACGEWNHAQWTSALRWRRWTFDQYIGSCSRRVRLESRTGERDLLESRICTCGTGPTQRTNTRQYYDDRRVADPDPGAWSAWTFIRTSF